MKRKVKEDITQIIKDAGVALPAFCASEPTVPLL